LNIAPFDVTEEASSLTGTDCVPQDQVQASLLHLARDDDRNSYHQQPVYKIRLSRLAKIFETSKVSAALALLNKRLDLQIDDVYTAQSKDPMLSWNADQNFIDFFTCVSAGIGLDAFQPNDVTVHNYEFAFNVRQPIRRFRSKYAMLGFDPVGAILWIGRSPMAEDVWIAMAPLTALKIDCPMVPAGTCSGSTQMSPRHYRILIFFLFSMLRKALCPGIFIDTTYPNLDTVGSMQACCNIL
jgi:hypothetical protein